jgi:hypothetical protein
MKSLFAALFLFVSSLFQLHHPVTIKVAPAPWHATGTSATAAIFNATFASLQPQAATAPSTPSPQPVVPAQTTSAKPARSNPVLPAPTSVLTASAAPANYVTQDELTTQMQIAADNLRSLIYQTATLYRLRAQAAGG